MDSMAVLLLLTIFTPLAGAAVVIFTAEGGQTSSRLAAMLASLVTLVLAAVLLFNFVPGPQPSPWGEEDEQS